MLHSVLFTVLLYTVVNAQDAVLCFGRNDSAKLSDFLYLVEELVKIRCGGGGVTTTAPTETTATTETTTVTEAPFRPADCYDYTRFNASSGIYSIWPTGGPIEGPVQVYCDMGEEDEQGEGGWTVIQRRGNFNGTTADGFNRVWADYKSGFGNLNRDFWLGNDNIVAITNQRNYTLKVFLRDWDDKTRYATYRSFYIENESQNYTIRLGNYTGTAGDSLRDGHNGSPFSTRDRDNSGYRCTSAYRGAYWYFRHANCEYSNLNGQYWRGQTNRYGGVSWYTFRGYQYSLKDTVMKIRPTNNS